MNLRKIFDTTNTTEVHRKSDPDHNDNAEVIRSYDFDKVLALMNS